VFASVSFGASREAFTIIMAGLVLAILNSIIKPLLVVLSLPVIVVSLGLFIVVINGIMVALLAWIYRPVDVTSFGGAIITGLVIGLVNFIVTKIVEPREHE
jgi:putative membrane protein